MSARCPSGPYAGACGGLSSPAVALYCRADVHARRGALRQPGRILAGQGAAPLSRLTPPAPLAGEPFRRQAFDKASPARGGVTEGDGGVHCRFAPQVSCKPRQNPALCFVGGDLRAKSRHFVPVALRNAACGRQCLHRPGKPCDAANPKRRAKTPALHCGREWVAMHKRQPSARPVGGPMGSSASARRGGAPQPSSTRHACCPRFRRPFALRCRAGVHARRGALRQPGRILIGQDAAPLSRLTPTAPLTGEPSGWRSPQSLPCKGLRSRAPPAAEKARRSRCSGRRMQACFSMRCVMRAPQTGNGGEAA